MNTLLLKRIFFMLLAGAAAIQLSAQEKGYWNSGLKINSYRLPLPAPGMKPQYLDLDQDGDPDVLRSVTIHDMPVQWIDDDDDMEKGDAEGDMDNDCLMIDRNRDGEYGMHEDLCIDWNDTDEDGRADMQVVVDNVPEKSMKATFSGHYMWVIDTDRDHIFNYMDWNTMELRCWLHDGQSDFYEDYSGQSAFLKVHSTPDRMSDPRLNWENPFLFYDPDKDGITEGAIRLLDEYMLYKDTSTFVAPFSGKITYASMSYDLDNDNAPGNEFDFDFTLGFNGGGFDYMDQVHSFKNMRGLPEADHFFLDKRWRRLSELIYPDHDSAWDLIFRRGQWKSARFVYDEDDDCNRWERVEFYDPLNLFRIGGNNKGLDHNRQADASGDRGEWDADNSGKGKLYISRFDGRIHLFGAEWGAWRIDQNAWSFQGMGGMYDGYGPDRLQKQPSAFATVKYTDTDHNGFLDRLQYDLDGDTIFENSISLKEIGLDDRCELIDVASMKYADLVRLKSEVADRMWANAQEALKVAARHRLQTGWYSLLMHPKSIRQKYHHGYWLQFYLFNDLVDHLKRHNRVSEIEKAVKAYYSGNWKSLM